MKYIILIAFAFLSIPVRASEGALPENQVAQYVVDHLDVTTFPSSIGPRRMKDKITFADYDFIPTTVTGSSAILQPKDKNWIITLTILSHTKSNILVCFRDQAKDGGTYYAQQALSLRQDPQAGMLKADKQNLVRKDCPELAL